MSTLAPLPTSGARRIVYFGTPDVAVPPLRALVAAGVEVALVVTRVDKRRGRGSTLSPSPVKAAALNLGLRVSHIMADALEVGADLGVVVAYGRIIPMELLSKLPMVNVHFSLLPRWRGAAPVERALMAGDTETGICIMRVEEGLDTGVVYDRVVVTIRNDHTLTTLRSELVEASLQPLIRAVTQGCGAGEPQRGESTHAAKIEPSELQIRWAAGAREIVALTKLETAWFLIGGKRVRLLAARVAGVAGAPIAGVAGAPIAGTVVRIDADGVTVACGDGAVTLLVVQPEGKTAMSAAAWANGARLPSSLA
ncbi:MAG: methionyl-tRNA formyltransferase [Ilumatobacteraceae bacterium]